MPVYTVQGPDGKVYDIEGPAQGGALAAKPETSVMEEVGRVADKALRGGALAVPGMIGDVAVGAPNWIARKLGILDDTPANTPGPEGYMQWPSDALATMTGGPVSKPQTNVGKAVGNIGEATVSSIAGPGSMLRNAVVGAGAGSGGELAARLTDDNPIARLLGGLAGGGATALAAAQVPTVQSLVKTATKGMTDPDWRRAHATAQTLQRENMPYLNSQLLGPSSSLDDLVMQASSHPEVRPGILQATRNIGPAAQSAAERWKLGNLPVSVDESRGLMLDLQNTAKQADWSNLSKANAAYVGAMPGRGAYKEGYVQALKDELKALASSSKYGPTTAGGKALQRFADEHLTLPPGETMPREHLNNLIKDLNVMSQQDGWKGLPVSDMKKVLKNYTPEFDAARAAKTAVMEDTVKPFRQGLAGQIAQMSGGPRDDKYTATTDIIKLVFATDKAQPQAIAKLGADIGGEQVGHIFREHLTRSMEHAAKGLRGGELTPANFVESIAGTPAQRTNLEAALKVVAKDSGANPAAVRNGFYELMHGFSTYKDLKLASGVNPGNLAFEAGKNIPGLAVAPQSRLGRYLWEKATAKTFQKISDLVTSPEGLAKLEQIARTPDPKVKGALVRGLIAATTTDGGNTPDVTTE